ncbi:MAG: hypothetical protein CK548_08910 [Opitutia bacterium]|nr:MAG: hypothetical protein CK548_08910 [Opitutae bacterium]
MHGGALQPFEGQPKFALAQGGAQGRSSRPDPRFFQSIEMGDEPQHEAGTRRRFLQRVVEIATRIGLAAEIHDAGVGRDEGRIRRSQQRPW